MPTKFTFKKEERPTGLVSIGTPYPDTNIKWQKKVVGYISAPNWHTKDHKWSIRLMIKKDEHPGWVWKTLKARFEKEPEAREFLNKHVDTIVGFGLYQEDDDY